MDKLHVNVTFTGGGAMFGFFMGAIDGLRMYLGPDFAKSYVGTSAGALAAVYGAGLLKREVTARSLLGSMSRRQIFRYWPQFYGYRMVSVGDSRPLRKLIGSVVDSQTLSYAKVAHSPLVEVVACDTWNKKAKYVTPDDPDFLDFVYASASFPIVFQPVKIGNRWYTDGGTVENAPFRRGIEHGADQIILITADERTTSHGDIVDKRAPGVIEAASLHMGALIRSQRESDLKMLRAYNDQVRKGTAPEGKRLITEPIVIQPRKRIGTLEINAKTLTEMYEHGVERGRMTAVRIMTKRLLDKPTT